LTSDDLTEVPQGDVPLDAVNVVTTDVFFGTMFADLFNTPATDDQGLVDDPVTSGGEESDDEGENDDG